MRKKTTQKKPKAQAQNEVQPEMYTEEKASIITSFRKHLKDQLVGSSTQKGNFWQIMLLKTWCKKEFGNY